MHARLTKYYIGALLCALLAGAVLPLAQAGSGDQMSRAMTGSLLEERTVRIGELHRAFLPMLSLRILSLTLQGAPVPQELSELLAHSEKLFPESLASFEEEAQRIFGASWETAWEEEEISGTLAERWRVYLVQIIEEAPALAKQSPLAAEDIRALATDLIARIQEAEKEEEDLRTLLPLLQDRLAELFPEDRGSLTQFQERAKEILAELPDALAILLREKERAREDFSLRASHLSAGLALLKKSEDIKLFREHFEGLQEDLLPFAPSIPIPQLRKDFEVLLGNLASSLREAEQVPLPLSEALDAVTALSASVRRMESEEDLKVILQRFEEILHALKAIEPPPETSTAS